MFKRKEKELTDSEALRKYLADRDFTEEEINYALKIVFEEIK